MIKYKVDVLETLKKNGYTTYALRKKNLLSESTIDKLRYNEYISFDTLDTICKLLQCDVKDLIYYDNS